MIESQPGTSAQEKALNPIEKGLKVSQIIIRSPLPTFISFDSDPYEDEGYKKRLQIFEIKLLKTTVEDNDKGKQVAQEMSNSRLQLKIHPKNYADTITDSSLAVNRFVAQNQIDLLAPELQNFTAFVNSNNRTDIERAYDDFLKEAALPNALKKMKKPGLFRSFSKEQMAQFDDIMKTSLNQMSDIASYESEEQILLKSASRNLELAKSICQRDSPVRELLVQKLEDLIKNDYIAMGEMNRYKHIGHENILTLFESKNKDSSEYMGILAATLRNKKISAIELANIFGIPKVRELLQQAIVSLQTPTAPSETQVDIETATATISKLNSNADSSLEATSQKSLDFQIEGIENEEVQEIINKVEIHGDAFNSEYLTVDVLKKAGLQPKYKMHIGDSAVWFSSGYEINNGRLAVVAYVENDNKITARSYYLSNSQSVWRYLPDYISSGQKIFWFGKGYSEESLTLPIAMQRALSEITAENMSVLKLQNSNLIFAGTTHKYQYNKPGDGDYYREIDESPIRLDNVSYKRLGNTPPEDIQLSPEQSPDFSKLMTSWKQKNNLYGQVEIEVFPSMDGKLKFMFCMDEQGRVWIGGVMGDSEIQSTGLGKSWVEIGDSLAVPAYEYSDQAGNYGNVNMQKDNYVDMYSNYLRKIPVIQHYLKSRSSAEKTL